MAAHLSNSRGTTTSGTSSSTRRRQYVRGKIPEEELQQQEFHATSKHLHRVSRREQATARSTLRHLPLYRYYLGRQAAGACSNLPALPWDLLAAAAGVTSWKLHPEQVLPLLHAPACLRPVAAAATGRLRALSLEYPGPQVWQLLAACTSLQELHLWNRAPYPHTPLVGAPGAGEQPRGDASSAGTTAVGSSCVAAAGDSSVSATAATGCTGGRASGWPLLPALKVLKLARLRYSSLAPWVQLQLGGGLEELWLGGCGPFVAHGGTLEHFRRLRSLEVDLKRCHDGPQTDHLVEALTALTSLTRLGLMSVTLLELPAAVLELTGLRCLDLSEHTLPALADTFTQPSLLPRRSRCVLRALPADLGVRLPALQVLRVMNCSLSSGLPSRLRALTRLEVGLRKGSPPLRGEELGVLRGLRHLALQSVTLHSPGNLSRLTGLEVLELARCRAEGPPCRPGQLAGLKLLRRFTQTGGLFGTERLFDMSAFVVAGAPVSPPLQHLSYLLFGSFWQRNLVGQLLSEQLPTLGPLPSLQQLHLCSGCVTQLGPLGPWLQQQTALTHLGLSANSLVSGDELQHVPRQLRALSVGCTLTEVPVCLTRLSSLISLDLRLNRRLEQLPGWLSQLRHLESLGLEHTGVKTRQEVLAALPLLRQVKLSDPASTTAAEVLASVPHLQFVQSE